MPDCGRRIDFRRDSKESITPKVGDGLAHKEDALYHVAPKDSVLAALDIMRERRIRAVAVLDEGRLVGIVAERDCALKVLLPGLDARRTTVEQLMTHDVVTVSPSSSLERCMVEMTTRSIRHPPVVHG